MCCSEEDAAAVGCDVVALVDDVEKAATHNLENKKSDNKIPVPKIRKHPPHNKVYFDIQQILNNITRTLKTLLSTNISIRKHYTTGC